MSCDKCLGISYDQHNMNRSTRISISYNEKFWYHKQPVHVAPWPWLSRPCRSNALIGQRSRPRLVRMSMSDLRDEGKQHAEQDNGNVRLGQVLLSGVCIHVAVDSRVVVSMR